MSGGPVKPGTVYLVGAGPGHPGLITRMGYELLHCCDAVAYDALIPLELIASLPARVERHYVGRRAGRHSMLQKEKNRLLAELALRGLNVVRLKGGDTSFFGGSVEEADSLASAGIPVIVVPGVTAASAVAAASGLPLTGRRGASWVFFATGHGSGDSPIPVPWREIASLRGGTIVIYMGLANLEKIVDQLLSGGNAADTPCMVVQAATTGVQRILESKLGDIVSDCRRNQMKPPALAVVGQVVRQRSRVSVGPIPLGGKRILVACCAQEIETVCAVLRGLGAEPLPFPSYILENLDDEDDWAKFSQIAASGGWCIFANELEVRSFFEALLRNHLDIRSLGRMKVAAIGHKAESALLRAGIRADLALSGTPLLPLQPERLVIFSEVSPAVPPSSMQVLRLKLFRIKQGVWESHWVQEVRDNPPDFLLFRNREEIDGFVGAMGLEAAQDLARRSTVVASTGESMSAARRWSLHCRPEDSGILGEI
jgi:uroporphyrinogen III methyltransferase / synthase